MCGLYGFINRGLTSVNSNGLVKGLAISAKSRGSQATGISYNVKDSLCVIKSATPADKFIVDIPTSVSAVIGHTRATTQGSEKFNYNNHPFLGDGYSLAHNGVLDNDYELKKSESLPDTVIETDSYAAVQVLDKYKQGSITFDSLRKMSELVSGMFAFSILDDNNVFWLVRNDSPIHMVYFKKHNLYVYGSTEQIVKDGLKKAGLGDNYKVIDVPVGSLMCIDLDGTLSFDKFTPQERVWNYKYAIANGGGYGYDYGQKYSYTNSYDIDKLNHEDGVWWDLIAHGMTDDEADLMLDYYSLQDLDYAINDGNIDDLFLEALRDSFFKNMTKSSYKSPYYKNEGCGIR